MVIIQLKHARRSTQMEDPLNLVACMNGLEATSSSSASQQEGDKVIARLDFLIDPIYLLF